MKYENTYRATFIRRLNRFVARVRLDGQELDVHVKNTGRCQELLMEGAEVCLQKKDGPGRKTPYDLISVFRPELGWVNIDSQVCNQVVEEYLTKTMKRSVQREVKHGSSRFDFLLDGTIFAEVKGCTLHIDGSGYFPDAPTQRGRRHVEELTQMALDGQEVWLIFVLAMNHSEVCLPNAAKDPAFARALEQAAQSGVRIFDAPCQVEMDTIEIRALNEKQPGRQKLD